MVWFHGGDDGFGAGATAPDTGDGLAKKGVVVVTVNYRGGPLALLATAELSKESGHKASGDYNIMDDIAALKWVKRNIAAFGGDPGNVTIFGQSFGASTVQFLSASPLAKGLFRKMIVESHVRETHDPEAHSSSSRSLKQAEADGANYMADLGVKSMKEMRALPWEKLIEVYSKEYAARGEAGVFMTFIRDGYALPRSSTAVLAKGGQAHVPVMAGDNVDETGAAPATAYDLISAGKGVRVNFPAPHTLAEYQAAARKKFGPMADELLMLYPASDDRGAFMAAITVARDNNRMSTWLWAHQWRAKQSKPVYLYYWTHAPPGRNHDITGAAHGSEVAYVYNRQSANAAWTDEDRKIADMMSSYWVNFARTGNPNGSGLPRWAPYNPKVGQAMELGDHFAPVPLPDKAKADFWRRFYASQPAR
jgi:para-nitrobenzyl esterase